MKIVYVTDLHGSKWKYERLINIAKNFKADVVINGGDMLPKDGDLFDQKNFIVNYLNNHFSDFNQEKIYYLCYLGNDDLKIFDDLFEEICNKYSFIFCIAQRKIEIGKYSFVGMNWVVDYPFRLKDRCRKDTENYIFSEQLGKGVLSTKNGWSEVEDWFTYANKLPTIADELTKLVLPKNMKNSIYVIHMPPYELGLDKCADGREIGSKAIYDFLLKIQPKISLHGHVHESPEITGCWQVLLGNTTCIQPGQLDDFTYVTIDLLSMKIERIKESK